MRRWLLLLAGCGRIGFSAAPAGGDGPDGLALSVDGPVTQLPLTADRLIANLPATFTGDGVDPDGTFHAPGTPGTYVVHVATADQALDVSIVVTDVVVPHAIATVGALADASGMAQQTHLFYAADLLEWWVFTQSSVLPTQVLSLHSPDFATWMQGAALEVGHPNGGDGRNLTIASAFLGGRDVVHLSVGWTDTDRGRSHAKATIDQAGLVFEAAEELNHGGAIDPDGPAVAITGSGSVVDASGWDQTPQAPPLSPCGDGDAEIYTSAAPDTGPTSFATMAFSKQVIWCVPNRVDARYLYAYGETLYHVYEDGGDEPDPSELIYQVRHPDGTWTPTNGTTHDKPPAVFPDGTFEIANWTVHRIGDALHAVLRTGDGAYHHAMLSLGSDGAWTPLAVPEMYPADGHGMYFGPYGTGAILVALGNGVPGYTWFDGAAWTPWHALAMPEAPRDYLAGAEGTTRPGLIWTEAVSSGNDLEGAALP